MYQSVVGLLVLVGLVSAHPGGAPDLACDSLTPNHGAESQDLSANPYVLTVNKDTIKPGEKVFVTLNVARKEDETPDFGFKGFLVVAKTADTGENVGTMDPHFDYSTNFVQQGLCEGAGITQNINWTNKPYFVIDFNWTAPSDYSGSPVKFYATAVQQKDTFWANFEGNKVVTIRSEEAAVEEGGGEILEESPLPEESGTDAESPVESGTDAETPAEGGADVGTDAVTDAGTDAEADADTDAETEVEFEEMLTVDEDTDEMDTNSTTFGDDSDGTSGTVVLHHSWLVYAVLVLATLAVTL